MLYYMFTTLSTVGLGDISPTNDIERIMCILVLLFGVLLITYLMDIMVELLHKYKDQIKDLEDDQRLLVFLSTLVNFNQHMPLEPQMKQDIIDYFHYRWQHDPNASYYEEEDK